MKLENKLIIAACISSLVIAALAYNAAEGETLENYEGAGRTIILPNRPDVGSASEAYYRNRQRMAESVRVVDSEDDAARIVHHVIDNNGIMDEEGLREAGVSVEGFNQLIDDANLGY
jgi:hypothetical protein